MSSTSLQLENSISLLPHPTEDKPLIAVFSISTRDISFIEKRIFILRSDASTGLVGSDVLKNDIIVATQNNITALAPEQKA